MPKVKILNSKEMKKELKKMPKHTHEELKKADVILKKNLPSIKHFIKKGYDL